MWIARYDTSKPGRHKVLEVRNVGTADDVMRIPLADNEAVAPISDIEARDFIANGDAEFVDGVFTPVPFVPPVMSISLEEAKRDKLDSLERLTSIFISRKPDGDTRYTREKQTLLTTVFSRSALVVLRPETPAADKAKGLDRLAAAESVFAWIDQVMDARYSYTEAINAATSIEELEAIVFDFSDLEKADPGVKLSDVLKRATAQVKGGQSGR